MHKTVDTGILDTEWVDIIESAFLSYRIPDQLIDKKCYADMESDTGVWQILFA